MPLISIFFFIGVVIEFFIRAFLQALIIVYVFLTFKTDKFGEYPLNIVTDPYDTSGNREDKWFVRKMEMEVKSYIREELGD